jgi:hypothetical protein
MSSIVRVRLLPTIGGGAATAAETIGAVVGSSSDSPSAR